MLMSVKFESEYVYNVNGEDIPLSQLTEFYEYLDSEK